MLMGAQSGMNVSFSNPLQTYFYQDYVNGLLGQRDYRSSLEELRGKYM